MSLLEVKNLTVEYRLREKTIKAVNDVSFDLERGDALGVVGESGCGKTSLALALTSLLPANGRISYGTISLDGLNLRELEERELRNIRWKKISMIFQSAMNSLDPLYKVGDFLMEALGSDQKGSKSGGMKRIEELFKLVGLSYETVDRYPHELSGGMKQRVVIAMSLLHNPDLVIADEPTTALDVIVQDQILRKIRELQKKFQIALILISHDISTVVETCDKMAVMYAGEIVELGSVESIFEETYHPYTKALLKSVLSIRGPLKELATLPGHPPDLVHPMSGCAFAPRCKHARDSCRIGNELLSEVSKNHFSRCQLMMPQD